MKLLLLASGMSLMTVMAMAPAGAIAMTVIRLIPDASRSNFMSYLFVSISG